MLNNYYTKNSRPSRIMPSVSSILPLVFFLGVSSTRSNYANAWGTEGHRVVANLAWRLIQEETRDAIVDILALDHDYYGVQMIEICGDNEDPCSPLGAVAEWADDVKKERGSSGPSHSINTLENPLALSDESNTTARTIDFNADCPKDDCIIGDIVTFTNELKAEPRLRQRRQLIEPPWYPVIVWFRELLKFIFMGTNSVFGGSHGNAEKEALMFLTHLMGDIHQPLHNGRVSDAGGTKLWVTFMDGYNEFLPLSRYVCPWTPKFLWGTLGCEVNLHGVWDFNIITKAMKDGSRLAFENDIWDEFIADNEENKEVWLSCFNSTSFVVETVNATQEAGIRDCLLQWSMDSMEMAWEFAYRRVDGSEILLRDYLGEDYYLKNLPVVRKQLAKGGVRFAAVLDRLFVPSGRR